MSRISVQIDEAYSFLSEVLARVSALKMNHMKYWYYLEFGEVRDV